MWSLWLYSQSSPFASFEKGSRIDQHRGVSSTGKDCGWRRGHGHVRYPPLFEGQRLWRHQNGPSQPAFASWTERKGMGCLRQLLNFNKHRCRNRETTQPENRRICYRSTHWRFTIFGKISVRLSQFRSSNTRRKINVFSQRFYRSKPCQRNPCHQLEKGRRGMSSSQRSLHSKNRSSRPGSGSAWSWFQSPHDCQR